MSRRVLHLIGSWWATALLTLAPACVYLARSFGRNPFPAWQDFMLHSPAGIAILAGLIVNLSAVSVRIALSRLRRPAVSANLVRSLDIHVSLPKTDADALRQARDLVGGDIPAGGTGVRRVTGAWSFLPGAVLRAGIVVTLAALLVSAQSREVYETTLREGDRKDILGAAVEVVKIDAALPADFLQVGEDSTFRLADLSVTILSRGREHRVTPGFPARFNGLFWRVRHLGISQPLSITMPPLRTDLTAGLNVLPPGHSDVVPLPQGSRFLTFTLDPDKVITKGLMTGRQYDLTRPAYRVVLQSGRGGTPHSGRVAPGGRIRLADASVAVGPAGLFVRLQVVSDPALPFFYAGIIILLAGLAAMVSRFFWYEREIAAADDGEMLLVGRRDEYFKKWGMHRFQQWKDGPGQG